MARPRTVTRRSTSTANFGSGKREAHDASAFYERFVAPEISADDTVAVPLEIDRIYCADARVMTQVASDSVALVVTSPPYFAGKAYEEDLSAEGVPADYFEYLQLLRDVFGECKRVLEPGGRIAVNVANLGRRPYRSLSADVTGILEELGLLMRGEVIWWKGRAAGGSCAWGSFQRPTNPVLRDVTERIVIASKGRFDRALTQRQRHDKGLPSIATISREEFMDATTDLWELAPESAKRVGHPAPFPVELPRRLIDLYTYAGDVVLDPFMGSGSTALAAVGTDRHYLGFDTDGSYVGIAEQRVAELREELKAASGDVRDGLRVEIPAIEDDQEELLPGDALSTAQRRAIRGGRQMREVAEIVLNECGFSDVEAGYKPRGLGIVLSFSATDRLGGRWAFDVSGTFSSGPSGLRRKDTLWKSLGVASVLHSASRGSNEVVPLVLLSTDLPVRGTAGCKALEAVRGPGRPVHDALAILSPEGQERLAQHAELGPETGVVDQAT
jgi:site-specific DNA-methyltransferase (adenine-specific)